MNRLYMLTYEQNGNLLGVTRNILSEPVAY